MDELPILLDRTTAAPLAVQLVDALRSAPGSGALRVGDQLPSTRALARRLAVSRTVTAAAYDQLLAEGWVTGRRGSGTFVTATPARSVPHAARRAGGPGGLASPAGAPEPEWIDLRTGAPCTHVLDRAAWRRAWRAAADPPPDRTPRPAGLPSFQRAVVEHLLRHRGLAVPPEQVLATAGTTAAVGELAALLPAGARVAVEEPGYRRAAAALAAAGLRVLPAALDRHGLVVDALPAGLAAVYCTPAHQFPLGERLDAARRVALVARARQERMLVIEDDYDGELRYDVAPLPLLAALGPDVVVHLGTTSKLLTPTLGTGWLVAPPQVRAALLAHRERAGARPSPAGQLVFAALASSGDFARHLRRLRRELAARRDVVSATLGAAGVEVRGDAAGAHVVVPLPTAGAERELVARMRQRGVGLDGLGTCHAGPVHRHGITIGYAGPTRDELATALDVLTACLRSR